MNKINIIKLISSIIAGAILGWCTGELVIFVANKSPKHNGILLSIILITLFSLYLYYIHHDRIIDRKE